MMKKNYGSEQNIYTDFLPVVHQWHQQLPLLVLWKKTCEFGFAHYVIMPQIMLLLGCGGYDIDIHHQHFFFENQQHMSLNLT